MAVSFQEVFVKMTEMIEQSSCRHAGENDVVMHLEFQKVGFGGPMEPALQNVV